MDKENLPKSKTALWIAVSQIKKWVMQPRVYVVLFSVFIFAWTKIQFVREYAKQQHLSVSCWFFPFLFSTGIGVLFLYFGLILMYCNAPFVDQQQMFVILRSGKKKWFVGQLLYIVLTSFIYFAVVVLVSVLEFVPYLGFSTEWGSVLFEAARNPEGTRTYVQMLEQTMTNCSPVKAFLIIYFANVGIGIFLGFLIFLVNLYKSRTYGSVIAFIIIFVSDLVSGIGDFKDGLLYISPVSWTNLNIYYRNFGSVSCGYVFAVLLLLDLLLAVLIMRRSSITQLN